MKIKRVVIYNKSSSKTSMLRITVCVMFMQSFVQIVPPVKEEIGCTETYVAINMKSTQACLL